MPLRIFEASRPRFAPGVGVKLHELAERVRCFDGAELPATIRVATAPKTRRKRVVRAET